MGEIVRKNPDQVGFAVNPRHCVVERFFAWIGRNRRLAKDFEATIESARAFLYASVMPPVRRIARAFPLCPNTSPEMASMKGGRIYSAASCATVGSVPATVARRISRGCDWS
jgi:hypothetical protein